MTQPGPQAEPGDIRIFVSHSHKDHEFCARLVDALRRDFGEDAVWYDQLGGLGAGDEWWTKIRTELRGRPIYIPVFSPDAMESHWVNDELTLAWVQRNQPGGKTIIPVLYRPCTIRDDFNTLKNKVSFVTPKSFDAAYAELTKQLRDFAERQRRARLAQEQRERTSQTQHSARRIAGAPLALALSGAVVLLAASTLAVILLNRGAHAQGGPSASQTATTVPTVAPTATYTSTPENPTVVYQRSYRDAIPGPCSSNPDAAYWKANEQEVSSDSQLQGSGTNTAYVCKSSGIELAVTPQSSAPSAASASITFMGHSSVPLPPHHTEQCTVSGLTSHGYVQVALDGVYLQINGDGTYGYNDGHGISLDAGSITLTNPMTIEEVYDGSAEKFYVNGHFLLQFSATPPANSQGMVITLGAYNPTGPNLTSIDVSDFTFTPSFP